jgi:RNA polymerase sigma-70 factor, ECF subfamily
MFWVYSLSYKKSYKVCNFSFKPTNSIGEARLSENETLFKQLIQKAQGGDGASYAELLQGLNSFLKNYLRKRIFDQNEIDEVTQEILLAVHKSLHTYDTKKSFMGWFLAIAEYKIVDYIRSLKKRSNTLDLNSVASFFAVSNSDSDLKLDVERAINNLSSREKDVLTLIKVDGQSINAVAKQLNLTEANVKVIAHRAYLNIKTYLGIRS